MNKNYREQNLDQIVKYFENGCKTDETLGYGLEIEHFIVNSTDKSSVPYCGANGVEEILHDMNKVMCGTRTYSEGHQIGIVCPDYNITIEPAGQLEISIDPCKDLSSILQIYRSFRNRMEGVLKKRGLALVTLGYHPVSKVRDLPLIPKKRYEYMDAYFARSGKYGINMMRGTASTQISIDYHSEEDFVRKFRLAYILSPLIKLLSDNTPVFEGEPAFRPLMRSHIWEDVDKARCGCVPGIQKEDFGFRAYAEYLWNTPLILRTKGEETICTGDKTVGEVYGEELITKEDVEHIISMVFPDVRLKKYIEIRMADSMDEVNMVAYAAFIKGIFSSDKLVRTLTREFSAAPEIVDEAEKSLMEKGFAGRIYGFPARYFALEMLEWACMNLDNGEKMYLKPFYDRVHAGVTLAQEYYKE